MTAYSLSMAGFLIWLAVMFGLVLAWLWRVARKQKRGGE
jgi:cbb3-type cytochrome oxidase subunit 3